MTEKCLLCSGPGKLFRERAGSDLVQSYSQYLGAPLPEPIASHYFKETAQEYWCGTCNLRWYTPDRLGDSDYYAALAKTYSWYYRGVVWDKEEAIKDLIARKPGTVLEIGCGDGWFLEALKANGLKGVGVDINVEAIKAGQGRGLSVFLPDQLELEACDVMCLFQTIEHVSNPAEFLKSYMTRYKPKELLLSAPCHESILGYTSDPLSWPPHHRTAWSRESFEVLAKAVGCGVKQVWHQPLSYYEFQELQRKEPAGRFWSLPYFPSNLIGRWHFRMRHLAGYSWTKWRHSIMVRMA
jgi:SAM-dependent methyltransferase